MSDVKPALSPEQWEQALSPHAPMLVGYGQHFIDEEGDLVIERTNDTSRDGWPPVRERIYDRRRVAALALHGQSYGFTWEDVDRVRRLADEKQRETATEKVLRPHPLHDLADRLSALLPPREEP